MAGVDLGRAVALGVPPDGVPCTPVAGRLIRFEGDEHAHVIAVVTADPSTGAETTTPCDTAIVGLGLAAARPAGADGR